MPEIHKLSWDTVHQRDGSFGHVSVVSLTPGGKEDREAPRATVHRVKMKPGQIAARHAHPGYALTIILDGTATFDGVEYGRGDMLLAEPLAQYGPLVPGPDGVETIEVFESTATVNPIWADPDDPLVVALWESLGGNPYR